MIIFLYGQDTYRSCQKLKEIIGHYKEIHKSGLNLRYFDRGNLNFQDFKSETETLSIFREKKLVVLNKLGKPNHVFFVERGTIQFMLNAENVKIL